jgi:hypothetical protein
VPYLVIELRPTGTNSTTTSRVCMSEELYVTRNKLIVETVASDMIEKIHQQSSEACYLSSTKKACC